MASQNRRRLLCRKQFIVDKLLLAFGSRQYSSRPLGFQVCQATNSFDGNGKRSLHNPMW